MRQQVITASGRRACGKDQDRTWDGPLLPSVDDAGAGIVVCDGVGSEVDSGPVAEVVVRSLSAAIQSGMRALELPDQVEQALASETFDGSTTVLAAIAHVSGMVEFVAAGNGSVIEVVFLSEPTARILSWTDHFIPHIDYESGRDALTSFARPGAPLTQFSHGVLNGGRPSWRAFVLCSDGISTLEDRRQGRVGDGSVWREVPTQLEVLFEALRDVVVKVSSGGTPQEGSAALSASIDGVLDRLAADGLLDDDASIAVALVPPVADARAAVPLFDEDVPS